MYIYVYDVYIGFFRAGVYINIHKLFYGPIMKRNKNYILAM